MEEKSGYEIAVERIEEVVRTGATRLDLSGLGLTRVPDNLIYKSNNSSVRSQNEEPITFGSASRRLRIVVCYSQIDRSKVQELYELLIKEGWMDIWVDYLEFLPGLDWDLEIKKAVNNADAVILCFSKQGTESDLLPAEYILASNNSQQRPEGTIFIIPLRLDDCNVPPRFRSLQYENYFPEDNKKGAYQRLLKSLEVRAKSLSIISSSAPSSSRSLRVFLCHTEEDRWITHELHSQLSSVGWLDIWDHNFNLLPGNNWEYEIRMAIYEADVVIACLSNQSIQKEGYFQKDLRMAMDIALEKKNGTDYLIPLRLERCEVPEVFRDVQHIDYFSRENQDSAYYDLVERMRMRAKQLMYNSFETRNINLASLDLSNNRLISLPDEIGQFTKLTELNLDRNNLTTLPLGIGRLAQLTSLHLSHNQLARLSSEVGRLTKLKSLSFSHNQVVNLPLFLKNLKDLEELDIRENPLSIPPEIIEKFNEPQIILNYLVELWGGQRRPLAETKMLVVGQGSVGKTSLIRRLTDNAYSSSEHKTEGIAINRWKVTNFEKGEKQPDFLRVNIWDFGGQEIMHATHQFFLTHRSLYMLVLDARISQEENRVEYWLKIIQSFGGESPVLIVGNKIDQHPLDIDRTGLRKKYPNIVDILETSAASGEGLRQLKSAITEQVNKLPHVRDSLPEVWFNVKNQLEELGQVQNYISQEKYTDTCIEGEIHDEISQRTLIGFLHDLGIVLHFQDDPRLETLGILNPQWVTNGVYKILNTRDIFDNKGVMTLTMLNEILDSPEYPSDKRLFIVEMMRKFELCYDIDRDKFLIPDLLPISEPFVGEKEWEGALAFQYHYNVLPSSIITRFIVRMNELIHKTVWRSGVVLKKDDNTALVKADTEERKIYIWVNGAENTRRDFLSVIRAEFDAIHKTIIKIEAVQKVPHPAYPDLILDYEELLQFERKQIPEFQRSVKDEIVTVNVRQLLNGVRVGSESLPVVERTSSLVPVAVQSSAPVSAPVEKPSLLMKIVRWVFIEFPKAIGRIPLDLVGKGKDAADTTTVSLGYGIIILVVLIWLGYVGFDPLLAFLKDVWRFFFPLKP